MLTHGCMTAMGKIWEFGRRTSGSAGEALLTAADRASLATVSGAVTTARPWLHFWYCDTERDARAAADRMRESGWGIRRLGRAVGEDGWAVIAVRTVSVIDERTVSDARRFFTDLARRHHGDYDGWEYGVDAPAPSHALRL